MGNANKKLCIVTKRNCISHVDMLQFTSSSFNSAFVYCLPPRRLCDALHLLSYSSWTHCNAINLLRMKCVPHLVLPKDGKNKSYCKERQKSNILFSPPDTDIELKSNLLMLLDKSSGEKEKCQLLIRKYSLILLFDWFYWTIHSIAEWDWKV